MQFTTRAALLEGPRKIRLVERRLSCGEDEVVVKTHLMGICGSDKSFYRGQLPAASTEFRQAPQFPYYLGHESGGTVAAVGSRVSEYGVGDRVMSFGWNNTFADYFVAKAWQLQPAPDGMDMDLASLGEPIACAMYSGMQSEVALGDFVVIMGGGFAGLIIAQCAKRMGADHVMVVDTLAGKLRTAASLGADSTANAAQDDVVALVKERTKGRGADVLVEAAGSEASMNMATEVLRHAGKLVFYSWMTQPVTLNISRWHDDGFKLINTCLVHHTWQERFIRVPTALRPVVQGHIQVKPLITNELPLADLARGFELADKDESAIKIVFRP